MKAKSKKLFEIVFTFKILLSFILYLFSSLLSPFFSHISNAKVKTKIKKRNSYQTRLDLACKWGVRILAPRQKTGFSFLFSFPFFLLLQLTLVKSLSYWWEQKRKVACESISEHKKICWYYLRCFWKQPNSTSNKINEGKKNS